MVRLWNVSNVSLLLHNTHITELFDVAAQSLLKLFYLTVTMFCIVSYQKSVLP